MQQIDRSRVYGVISKLSNVKYCRVQSSTDWNKALQFIDVKRYMLCAVLVNDRCVRISWKNCSIKIDWRTNAHQINVRNELLSYDKKTWRLYNCVCLPTSDVNKMVTVHENQWFTSPTVCESLCRIRVEIWLDYTVDCVSWSQLYYHI